MEPDPMYSKDACNKICYELPILWKVVTSVFYTKITTLGTTIKHYKVLVFVP